MFLRVILASGLLLLGYYVGREIGRTETVREELRRRRDRRAAEKPADYREGRT